MIMGNEQLARKWYVIIFIMLFVGSMTYLCILNNTDFYYDDAVYWSLGRACGWDVRNMAWGFRGWLLPYIFSMCYKFGMMFGSELLGYRIFASFVFAFTFTFLFKKIAKIAGFEMSDQDTAVAGGVCGVVFYLFFRGLFVYTLSDFYAFTISLMSIILVHDLVEKKEKLYVKGIRSFILGLFLYGAYNIRTIYLFLGLACLAVLIALYLLKKRWMHMAVVLPVCLAGMLICAIPQIVLNYHLSRIYSWWVPTEGLMLFQLHCGVYTQRYATYVGDLSQYGMAGRMFFVDKIGEAILQREQITEFTSYSQVFKLVLKYPLDFAGIYIRHLLNMLYPIYPAQYIQDIRRDKSLFLALFYTVLYIASSNFIHSFRLKSSRWIWLGLLLLPCICILPGAVEIRFFIALHFVIYFYAFIGIKMWIGRFRENKVRYSLLYLTGFMLYIGYAGMLLSTTAYGTATIH